MSDTHHSVAHDTYKTPRPSANARTRRPHTKSRHGCLGCKQGRKKCDEQRPQCLRCIEKDVPCEYPRKPRTLRSTSSEGETTWNRPQNLSIPSPYHTSFSSTPSLCSRVLSYPAPSRTINPGLGFLQPESASSVDLRATELELLAYYLSHSARSLAFDGDDLYALQVGFPNLAFRSKPLMSSILALAAVHKCHEILVHSGSHIINKTRIQNLLALADEHHRASLRQTQADIPHANHYDHVVANAPLMVLYATANHSVRIRFDQVIKVKDDSSTNLPPAQLHWVTLIRAAHLAYTGLLNSAKDFSQVDEFTASPREGTPKSQLMGGMVPLAEDGPTSQTRKLLMPIIRATSSSALEKLRTRAQTLQLSLDLMSPWEQTNKSQLQSCLTALEALAGIMDQVFQTDPDLCPASSQQPDLENGWAALSQLSDVSPWLRSYLARVTFSTPPKPLRRTIMWFLNQVPGEFLCLIQTVLDNIPTYHNDDPDEGVQCDSEVSSDLSCFAIDIFAHWLVFVMLLDGVWWIGGIGVCELDRITRYLGRQKPFGEFLGSKETWWPRSMLTIAIEIEAQV
ncbi:hypothetical protein F66182_1903 [Fusarium sp. NRRL 66182]|nr:hypothetical protein F66182_1903 [Fusarium sp. NRRL 66182]